MIVNRTNGLDVLRSVCYGTEAVIMGQQRTLDTIIHPDTEELSEEDQTKRAWAELNRIRARNQHLDPEEEMAFITRVVEEVRQERYERRLRETEDGG